MMDRLSNLPDEVLCHILSFLTTKEAALTSILAKSWRNLLAFVPSLTISDSVFLHPEHGKKDRPDIIQSFKDFVVRVLAMQGNSPLKKFSLKCDTVADTDRLDGWISNVLARGVSDLDLEIILDCREEDNYQLSPKCFECSTLVKLKLNYGIYVSVVTGRVFLLLLKTLVLQSVPVCPNEFEVLLRALPSLEELVLVYVTWKDMKDVRVSSASIKTLTINLEDSLNTLSFDAPSLLHFNYSGSVASDYPVVNMENMVDAKINFLVRNNKDDLQYSNAWKLFHGVRNAANLGLFLDTLHVLSVWSESVPVFKFNDLKSLAVKVDEHRGWPVIPALLRNSPHLQTLVFEGLVHHVTDECGDVCHCISREDKGFSLTVCPVKVVKIHGFQGTMKEVVMIEHFLDYLPCLKEMEVVYAEDNNNPTRRPNHGVSKLVSKIFQLYNKYSSCNIKLMHQGEIICV